MQENWVCLNANGKEPTEKERIKKKKEEEEEMIIWSGTLKKWEERDPWHKWKDLL